MESALRINMVRENLALAMALWGAAKRGVINCSFVPASTGLSDSAGDGVEAGATLVVQDNQELVRCAANQVRGAFTLSVMQAHQTLVSVFGDSPLEEANPDLRAARCAIFLLHHTFSGDAMTPIWDCPSGFRQRLEVRPISFALDPSTLHGKAVYWDDFGGLNKYLQLLEYCKAQLADSVQADLPHEAAQDDLLPTTEDMAGDDAYGAEDDWDDSVTRFIEARCAVDLGEKIIARSLYDTYLDWCQERGITPLAQRSFGMRLTSLGFERRRRGRGRHWWLGIGLAQARSF